MTIASSKKWKEHGIEFLDAVDEFRGVSVDMEADHYSSNYPVLLLLAVPHQAVILDLRALAREKNCQPLEAIPGSVKTMSSPRILKLGGDIGKDAKALGLTMSPTLDWNTWYPLHGREWFQDTTRFTGIKWMSFKQFGLIYEPGKGGVSGTKQLLSLIHI